MTEVKRRLPGVEGARLKEGAVGLIKVYDARNALLQARQQELQNVIRWRRAMMELEMVSGSVPKDQGLETLVNREVVLDEAVRLR